MKNILFGCITLLLLILTNCEFPKCGCTNIDLSVGIIYTNGIGQNLFDTATKNHFNTNDIKVICVENGIKTDHTYGNLDNANRFEIYKIDSVGGSLLHVFCETDTTLVQLSPSIIDTLTCEFDRSNGNTMIRKVWYNGILKWNNYNVIRNFTVVK